MSDAKKFDREESSARAKKGVVGSERGGKSALGRDNQMSQRRKFVPWIYSNSADRFGEVRKQRRQR